MDLDIPRIILVTDPRDEHRAFDITQNNSEGYTERTVARMLEALAEFSPEVIRLDDPKELATLSGDPSDWLVVPARFGRASPTSKTLVPAICEARGIRYIGADAYTQALCNDKYVSKLYARSLGLATADSVIIRRAEDASSMRILDLNFPVVVKPNFGGGSNGINSSSICPDPASARARALELLESQRVPVLVESYMPGYEVNTSLVTMPDGSIMYGEIGLSIEGKSYFEGEVFGLESKKRNDIPCDMKPCSLISSEGIESIKRVFRSFPKVGMMRVDCRVGTDGTPHLIELSPDCSLSTGSGIFIMLGAAGYSYSDMFRLLIEAELNMSQ